MKWLTFHEEPTPISWKTRLWEVVSYKLDFEYSVLGKIKWYGAWRKYAFFPTDNTLFDALCLRDIANFCEDRTKEQKKE